MGMDPVKIQGVSNWPSPTCVKEVQSFLGFVNFYRRFILDFAGIARPLHDLTKKDMVWTWDVEHEAAFEALKTRVTSAPVLLFPDDTKPFKVEADSSTMPLVLCCLSWEKMVNGILVDSNPSP